MQSAQQRVLILGAYGGTRRFNGDRQLRRHAAAQASPPDEHCRLECHARGKSFKCVWLCTRGGTVAQGQHAWQG